MSHLRALTLILTDPSTASRAFADTFGWEVEADFGSFAALALPEGIPLWINVPAEGEDPARGIVLHVASDDVDRSFEEAVARGARPGRTPQDMDFGARSATVTLADVPGVIIDLSHALETA